MLKLYYFPGSAGLTAHMLLEEIGAAYELHRVDRDKGDLDEAWFRKLNPFGRIPVLIDGDQVIYETGTVLTHIAEKFPDKGFIPPAATPERDLYNQWLSLLGSDVQQIFMVRAYPHRWLDDAEGQAKLVAAADRKLASQFDTIDAILGDGPYVLGPDLCAADFLLFLLTGYGRRLTPKAWERPAIGRHHRLLRERAPVQRVMQAHGLDWK